VQYAPTRGRFKVYLIDEVHMLSKHSFNALLKTLEEPPPHVKFLLATTDPQRLPVTILSRCLQFNLRRLSEDLIAGHLAHVLSEEAIPADPPAIARIARAADGSVRDALSLLDQAIAYGGGRVTDAEVCAMLGTIDRDHVYELLEALAGGDGAAMLEAVQRASEYTAEFTDLLDELISALQRIAVAQIVPQAATTTGPEAERVATLAGRLGREDVQLYYQIALIGRRDLPYCPDARTGVEMTLLRMLAFRPADVSGRPDAGTEKPAAGQPAVSRSTARSQAPATAAQGGDDVPPPARPAPSAPRASAATGDTEWDRIVARLDAQGMVRELAMNCALRAREPGRIRLVIDSAHSHLKVQAQRLQQALGGALGGDIALEIAVGEPPGPTPAERLRAAEQARREAALEALEGDADVRALRDVFNARILPDTVQPVD